MIVKNGNRINEQFGKDEYSLDLSDMDFTMRHQIVNKLFRDLDENVSAKNYILSQCKTELNKYSEKNQILIQLQRENVTELHKSKWYINRGRIIKSGEKAVYIRVPQRVNADESGVEDKSGEGKVRFYFEPLFDLTQTKSLDY
jgi:hypothetical protein